jgi:hypothetical protein
MIELGKSVVKEKKVSLYFDGIELIVPLMLIWLMVIVCIANM